MDDLLINIIKLLVAIVIGSIIGTERQRSGKPVGRRTLSLVIIGATLATITTLKYFPADTGRVLAGILTGIGFLGAGAIIATGKDVKGLTTAASIWAVSIIGIVIGLGDYPLAIIVTVIIYLILEIDRIIDKGKKKVKKIIS